MQPRIQRSPLAGLPGQVGYFSQRGRLRLLRHRQGHEHHGLLSRQHLSFFSATGAIWEDTAAARFSSRRARRMDLASGIQSTIPAQASSPLASRLQTCATAHLVPENLHMNRGDTQASAIITLLTEVHVQSKPEALYPPRPDTWHSEPVHGLLAALRLGILISSVWQSQKSSVSAVTMMWSRLNPQKEKTVFVHHCAENIVSHCARAYVPLPTHNFHALEALYYAIVCSDPASRPPVNPRERIERRIGRTRHRSPIAV